MFREPWRRYEGPEWDPTEQRGSERQQERDGLPQPQLVWAPSPQRLESTKDWKEAGRDSRRNGTSRIYIKHRQELDRQAADKRWVEELCEQQSGKQVSQRPRAKQQEPKEPGGRYLPTVLGTESSVAHDLDKCSITEWQAQLGKNDTLLKDRVFHRLALPASKSVKRLSQFP